MNVLIATIGSRGDVQPYVALGMGLKSAGHHVTICTSIRFQTFVEDNGLDYAFLNDDLLAILDTAEGRGALEEMGSFFSGMKTAIKLLKRTGPIQRSLLREAWEAALKVNPDLIVYNAKMGGAPHYADKLGIPAVMAVPFPQMVPTDSYPSLGFPRWNLGGGYNKLTYEVVLTLAGIVGGKYIKTWRRAHDLPLQPRGTDILHRTNGAHIPILHAYSPHVVPQPSDWPGNVVTTGYWFLNSPADWKPPASLEKFLASGEPPVYVGFGSMAGRDPVRVTRVMLQALHKSGLRGVLATGWGGLAHIDLPETVLALDHAPHDWLFPRMAAVVHHGGAGTTAAGLLAGRPTVICPFFGDQPFWGRRVHELGAGSAPIPQKRLTADNLAAAMREVTTNEMIKQAAEALGGRIRSEGGIANAVDFIEQFTSREGVRS